MAEIALFSLWSQHKQREVIGKPGMSGSVIGDVFEREVRRGFCQNQPIELSPYYLTTDSTAISLKISKIERIVYFSKETEIPHLPHFSCCLLQPVSERFSALDFIIEDAILKQIVLVQTTTLFPPDHDKGKIEKLISSGKLKHMLDAIFNTKSTTAIIENGHFVITLPASVSDWRVKVLYVTSQHDASVHGKSWEWKDVLVAGRETLQPLGLQFYEGQVKPTKEHHTKQRGKN